MRSVIARSCPHGSTSARSIRVRAGVVTARSPWCSMSAENSALTRWTQSPSREVACLMVVTCWTWAGESVQPWNAAADWWLSTDPGTAHTAAIHSPRDRCRRWPSA